MWVAGRGGAYCTRYSSTRDVQTMYACHSHGWSEARQPALAINQSIVELRGGIWGRTTALRRPAAGTPDACIDFGEKTNHPLPSPRALPQSPGVYQCRRVARQAEDWSLDASPRARRSFSNSRKSMVLPNTPRCRHGFRTGNHVVKVEIQSRLCRNVAACSRVVFRVSLPLYICASRGRPIVPGQ